MSLALPPDWFETHTRARAGDHVIDDGWIPDPARTPRAAAVLVPVIDRPGQATMLLTQRADHLRDHSGQIALPGGKIDSSDSSPASAALREAEEEVGLDPARVTLLGYLDPYLTGSGYLIVPTVGLVREPFGLTLNRREVDEAFEVPLAFLMRAGNHVRSRREVNGRTRSFFVMPYPERRIWGVTAGILRNLFEKLYL